jgi:SAM-dependent methyltransferase
LRRGRRRASSLADELFTRWIASLETRLLADLRFPEVSRALRALSSTYVERRQRLSEGAALSGAGKRAAFALFYGPIHHLLVREIVGALPEATAAGPASAALLDIGCGTGAAGAAWAARCAERPRILGIDTNQWAVGEAARSYREFGLTARTIRGDVGAAGLPKGPPQLVLAAFTLNEMAEATRGPLLERLIERATRGDRLLIVEPLAGFVARWWNRWRDVVLAAGGRADEWRMRIELPAIVKKLDRAAGLNHRELTGRSLFLAGSVRRADPSGSASERA